MKLLLDVQLSDRRIGSPLRAAGHDVFAAERDDKLRRLDDEPLLEWAWLRRRIVVTANAKDFVAIIGKWHQARKSHAGCMVISPSVGNRNYGRIISGVKNFLEGTTQEEWENRLEWLEQ